MRNEIQEVRNETAQRAAVLETDLEITRRQLSSQSTLNQIETDSIKQQLSGMSKLVTQRDAELKAAQQECEALYERLCASDEQGEQATLLLRTEFSHLQSS